MKQRAPTDWQVEQMQRLLPRLEEAVEIAKDPYAWAQREGRPQSDAYASALGILWCRVEDARDLIRGLLGVSR